MENNSEVQLVQCSSNLEANGSCSLMNDPWYGGGGCSGYRYVWGQTDEPSEEWLKPIDDILLIDTMTELLVKGSVIDYVEGLAGSFLDIQNPMQKTACGCGLSFGV